MMIAFYAFLLVLLLSIWRRNHKRYLNLKYKYRLYALRDDLRRLAAEEKVNKNHWVFKYLDSSICKTVNELPKLNIWLTLAIFRRHKDENERERFKMHLNSSLKKNSEFERIYSEYGLILFNYLKSKHSITLISSLVGFFLAMLLGKVLNTCKSTVSKSIYALREQPETSTYRQYLKTT